MINIVLILFSFSTGWSGGMSCPPIGNVLILRWTITISLNEDSGTFHLQLHTNTNSNMCRWWHRNKKKIRSARHSLTMSCEQSSPNNYWQNRKRRGEMNINFKKDNLISTLHTKLEKTKKLSNPSIFQNWNLTARPLGGNSLGGRNLSEARPCMFHITIKNCKHFHNDCCLILVIWCHI